MQCGYFMKLKYKSNRSENINGSDRKKYAFEVYAE